MEVQKMTINDRIAALRKKMIESGIDAWIISGSDPHQSEYTAERWTTRRWITGFTGSAGLVVVTADKAVVVMAKKCGTFKIAQALTVDVIKDPQKKYTIRGSEIIVAALTNPEAVCLITNTRK